MANRDETSIKWIKPGFCRPLVLVVIDIGLSGYYYYLDLLIFSCSNCIVCASLSYGSCSILYQTGAQESSDRNDYVVATTTSRTNLSAKTIAFPFSTAVISTIYDILQ